MQKLLLLFVLFFLAACQTESTYDTAQLIGQWKAVEWKDLTNDKVFDITVDFTFDADSRYVGNYGSKSEKGEYWISGDKLHTIEDGKAEKKVLIKQLSNDTLIFEMNRVGAIEEMVLVKQ